MASRSSDDAEQPDFSDGDIRLGPIGSGDTVKVKELIVTRASPQNLRICSPSSGNGLFFAANSWFSPSKPHITLHAGPDKSGPVLGVVHNAHTGPNTVGIGDPESNLNSMIWERLSRTSKWTHSTYHFEFAFGEEGRKSFI